MKDKDESNPAMRTNPKKRFMRGLVRGWLIPLLVLAAIIALFHLEENWRGKRAWNNYKEHMEARGAVFEFEKFVPPPVPDEENFAMTPLLRPLFEFDSIESEDGWKSHIEWKDPEAKARVESIQLDDPENWPPEGAEISRWTNSTGEVYSGEPQPIPSPDLGDWLLGERIDLAEWQEYYSTSTNFPSWPAPRNPAEDVLKALSRFDSELAELKRASKRPQTRFGVRYETENPILIFAPHYQVLKHITEVLRLKAIAELELGNTRAAFEDVELMFELADSIKGEPIMIGHLVRLVFLEFTIQSIWEGMLDHRWTPEQLGAFRQRFDAAELMDELRTSFEAERATGVGCIDSFKNDPDEFLSFLDGFSPSSQEPPDYMSRVLIRFVPKGWWNFEKLNYCRAFEGFIMDSNTIGDHDNVVGLLQQRGAEYETTMTKLGFFGSIFGHHLSSQILLPAMRKVAEKTVRVSTYVEMAQIAIALETYYLENQDYPMSLAELTSDFLTQIPGDPASGDAFHYERTDDGGFRLWSVGWNGVDEGGRVLYTKARESRRASRPELDWVWPAVPGLVLEESER